MSTLVAYGTSASDSIDKTNNVSYASVRTAASGDTRHVADSSLLYLQIGQMYQTVPTWYSVDRAFLFFDTSSITNNSIITSAILSIYGNYDFSDADFNIVIQNGQPTYPSSAVALTDYNYLYYQGSSSGGQLSTASFIYNLLAPARNDIPLNSNGLLWINKTGTTKLCLRSSKDIAGTTPTANVAEFVRIWAQQKGTGYIPYLTVEYTALSALPAQSTIKF